MADPESETSRWFAAEVQAHEPALRSYLRGAFPSIRDCDDVVQESYLRLWRTFTCQPIRSARGLLFQVARRLALDRVRRERVSPIAPGRNLEGLAVVQDEPDAAATTSEKELREHLVEAVAALPQRYREVVLMRRFEELPQKEVAQRLGLTERAVENLLARAQRRVEADLRGRGVLERYRR